MKKSILTIVICTFALLAFSQSKEKPAEPIHQQVVTDTTGLLQYKDYQELNIQLQEMPAKYAIPIMEWMNKRFQQRAQEYTNSKNK